MHALTAAVVISLQATGIALTYYNCSLPALEVNLLRSGHRVVGIFLLLIRALCLALDRKHIVRFLRKVYPERLWIGSGEEN